MQIMFDLIIWQDSDNGLCAEKAASSCAIWQELPLD